MTFPSPWRVLPSEAAAEPVWVGLEWLVALNRRITASTGEPHAVLSAPLLESAWAKPLNRWGYEGEADLLRLAVALMVGVAQNHPFQQGNKRTAFEAGLAFLLANGFALQPAFDSSSLADAFVALIAHESDEAGFAELLRPHVVDYG